MSIPDLFAAVVLAATAVLAGAGAAAYPILLRKEAAAAMADATPLLAGEPLRKAIEPRPLELFTTCPGCNLPGYHLLSAPRDHLCAEPSRVWVSDFDVSVWGRPETARRAQGRSTVRRWVTVIDRECLSCGKTWMETV